MLWATLASTVFFVTLLWWLDKYEKEPWGLFLGAFFYGLVPAPVLAVVLEVIWEEALILPTEGFTSGVVAPVVEESLKGLALLFIFFLWRREFDGVMDGLLYGAAIGLGFALTENVIYLLAFKEWGIVLLRILPFGLNHALFTAFTGVCLGWARQLKRPRCWLLLFPLGLGVGMFFHALHNLSVGEGLSGFFLALTGDWGGVILMLVVILLAWKQEQRWLCQELAEEVAAGVLAEAEHQTLLSLRRRVKARLWVWRRYGWRAFRLLGRFFNLATELAFYKHHLRAGTEGRRPAGELPSLYREIGRVRQELLRLQGGTG
ncbi:MAG: PrsW family intramembrane metalloprotease [Chloroflexia bacterium]